jgi:hypothetical protein
LIGLRLIEGIQGIFNLNTKDTFFLKQGREVGIFSGTNEELNQPNEKNDFPLQRRIQKQTGRNPEKT